MQTVSLAPAVACCAEVLQPVGLFVHRSCQRTLALSNKVGASAAKIVYWLDLKKTVPGVETPGSVRSPHPVTKFGIVADEFAGPKKQGGTGPAQHTAFPEIGVLSRGKANVWFPDDDPTISSAPVTLSISPN
ncbi:MAG: hypothetical protein A2156_16265 [Deltaproteobacteria bacterium RBG_16_48_10]|nr:MAG: hypothetical protein A2156_16265 [Deltaproteobacteria bacterium RBG_16_48_10]